MWQNKDWKDWITKSRRWIIGVSVPVSVCTRAGRFIISRCQLRHLFLFWCCESGLGHSQVWHRLHRTGQWVRQGATKYGFMLTPEIQDGHRWRKFRFSYHGPTLAWRKSKGRRVHTALGLIAAIIFCPFVSKSTNGEARKPLFTVSPPSLSPTLSGNGLSRPSSHWIARGRRGNTGLSLHAPIGCAG